ncbi:MAG: hypothetical protein AAF141_13405 [Pseudomonadota bacterium]
MTDNGGNTHVQESGPQPGKYVRRGVIGGLALGGVAWLAIQRALGGRLVLNSGEYEGFGAALILLGFGLIIGLIVAAAAFIMMRVLTRKSAD